MTGRERLLTVLQGKLPDCVPVCPDFSQMIPARLTGKPSWDMYLYNNPSRWEAYIACAKYFNIDALMDGFPLIFPDEVTQNPEWEKCIIFKNDERLITQRYRTEKGERVWEPTVDVYYATNPPNIGIHVDKIGLPHVPNKWEPLTAGTTLDTGPEGLKRLKKSMGDQGLIGVQVCRSRALNSQEDIYRYYDNPDGFQRWTEEKIEEAEQKFNKIMAMDVKPDFICVGTSGTLIFQTIAIFRKLVLPVVKRVIELATQAGIPTHVHSCGPEKELVKIFAEETSLTVIDPLEMPPMGDCDLAELKKLYGKNIVLKGNLHTTNTMLMGSVDDVIKASKKAITDAADGGRFILSTGDQCGRDTPDENLLAMIQTAREYGKY